MRGVGKQLNFALAKGTHASSVLLGSVVGEQQRTAGKGALATLQLFARNVRIQAIHFMFLTVSHLLEWFHTGIFQASVSEFGRTDFAVVR